jgi:OmpA-OmpF porin, OOP family
MRSTSIKTPATLAVACAIALVVFSATANAQARDSNEKAQSAATPAPTPAPLAAAAAALAVPVPVYEKVAFEAIVLFHSNKSGLNSAGRDSLDAFVGKIGGLDTQSVRAIGYADRMGSEAFNQILSEERVDAVKSYLVKKGVAADRVRTSAWGAARPSAAAAECNDANNPKNVACMQPDRRVFIEISGTRLAK